MNTFGLPEKTRRIPLSSSSEGNEGDHAVDFVNGFIYFYTQGRWIKWSFLVVGISQVFAYASDGDSNGVFYYMGTNFGASVWNNPFTLSNLGITSVDNSGGDLKASIVDRVASAYSTATTTNTIVFDLGINRLCVPSYYSYRYRSDTTTFAPTAWKVQGSNDNVNWTDLDTTTGQTPSLSGWVSRAITTTVAYRYFRYAMTGNNNNGTTHASIGEFELYGTTNF
jgi:hypothetical protein